MRPLVNSRLLVVKFWGSQSLYVGFHLCRRLALLSPVLFKVNCTYFFFLPPQSLKLLRGREPYRYHLFFYKSLLLVSRKWLLVAGWLAG